MILPAWARSKDAASRAEFYLHRVERFIFNARPSFNNF